MGTDARKLIADGYPLEQVVTSDLYQGGPPFCHLGSSTGEVKHLSLLTFVFVSLLTEFANLGHKLFKTTQETYPIAFVPGDVFDPNHLEIVPPMASSAAQTSTEDPPSGPVPDLRSLTSLNPLHGRVFAIHASSFFHLFDEEKQLNLARALAGLLSPEPGSMIFGVHIGSPEKGFQPSISGRDHHLWCHSPESWTELWDGLVFEKDVVKVQSKLVHWQRRNVEPDAPQNATVNILVWSVTRL